MTLQQELAGHARGAVDDPAPRHGGPGSDGAVPAQEMLVFLDSDEFVCVVDAEEAAGLLGPNGHVRDRILVACEEFVARQMRVQHV